MDRRENRFVRTPNCIRRMGSGVAMIIVLVIGPLACSSDPVVPTNELPEALFGSWSWTGASGGIAGVSITPESAGYTMTLVFAALDQVSLFRGGVVQASTTFDFVLGLDDVSATRSAQLLYAEGLPGFFQEQWVDIDTAGDLVLSDPCCDGFTYGWSRD